MQRSEEAEENGPGSGLGLELLEALYHGLRDLPLEKAVHQHPVEYLKGGNVRRAAWRARKSPELLVVVGDRSRKERLLLLLEWGVTTWQPFRSCCLSARRGRYRRPEVGRSKFAVAGDNSAFWGV